MGARARIRRTPQATGLAAAIAIHLLFLAAFVLTLKVAGSGREDRAVAVSLLPLELRQRRKASARPRAAPASPAPAPVQPPSPVPAVAGALPMAPRPDENLARFGAGLRGLVGCQDPDLYRLTAAERARCDARIVKAGKEAAFIPAPMAPEKRAAYDRRVKCRADYNQAPIPPGADMTRGLGYVPRLRDCAPGVR